MGLASNGGIIGGEEGDFSFGLSCYLTANIRVMLNYIRVLDLDRPGSASNGDEPSAVALRVHVDFRQPG